MIMFYPQTNHATVAEVNLLTAKSTADKLVHDLKQVAAPSSHLSDKHSLLTTHKIKEYVQTAAPQLTQIKAEELGITDNRVEEIKKTLQADAALANFPYRQDINALGNLALDWKRDNTLDPKIFKTLDISGRPVGTNGFVSDNGLAVYLFKKDSKENGPEYRLVFGGTTAGTKAADFTMRNLLNSLTTIKQWLANAKNVSSYTPASYKEAEKIADTLRHTLPADSKLSFSGHSKGGGEASYAAMMLAAKTGEPSTAINFSSAQLGKKLIKNIASEMLKKDPEAAENLSTKMKDLSANILHVSVKGDLVPTETINSSLHLGQTLTVPNVSDFGHQLNLLNNHNDFAALITSWATDGGMTQVKNIHNMYV
ncbi:lipase family protein [bacterium]|nr:lipase family protein [bacterium]